MLLVGAIVIALFIIIWAMVADAGVPKSWTVADAIKKGSVWGGKKARKGLRRMFEMHFSTFWTYGGGVDPATLSLVAHTETGHTGNPIGNTNDTMLGEACLLSVKRALARNLDVDVCHAPQCVWAAAKGRQMRREAFLSNYKWMQKLSPEDQNFTLAMVGGAGAGAANCFLKGSQARETCAERGWKCNLRNIVYDWIREQGEALAGEEYDSCWGRTNAQTAVFRVFRYSATSKIVIQSYGGGKKGLKRLKACTRPASILDGHSFGKEQFPGDDAHGMCADDPKAIWNLPPAGHRKKKTKHGLVDLWGPYCGELNGECTYAHVWEAWLDEKQAQGLIAPDDERAQVEAEMRAQGCWILD